MLSEKILEVLRPITPEERRLLNGSGIDRSIYMEDGSSTVNSKKLLSAGKLITVRPHTRFVHFPEHSHDYIEVIYMCSGQTTHIVNGDKIVLHRGELLFLGQNARQEILPAGENDIAVNFIILPEFFDSPLALLDEEESPIRHFIIDCLKNGDSSSCYLHFEAADILPVQNLAENLIWTLIAETASKRRITSLTMGLLFLHLVDYTERIKYQSRDEELILRVHRYIEDNYAGGSLTELAGILHYDFSWLSREIKRKTGKTYTEIVQEKRLAQACFLLRTTDMRVSDIAEQVGYGNISYFHRLFFGSFNMSPKSYRKNSLI